jgi:hypothetical protein
LFGFQIKDGAAVLGTCPLQHFQNEIIQFHFESFLEKTRFFQKSTPLIAARCPCGQQERLDFFKVKPL